MLELLGRLLLQVVEWAALAARYPIFLDGWSNLVRNALKLFRLKYRLQNPLVQKLKKNARFTLLTVVIVSV